MKILIRAIVLLALILKPFGISAEVDNAAHLSIIQLIATPEKFDGKLVAVVGFLHIGRESDLLFLSEEDYKHSLPENALWFHLSEAMGKDRDKLNRNYVVLVGIFRASRPGGYPCPNGGIEVVKRYSLWSSPSNPVGELFDDTKKPH
jgi:hypothetical protein